MKKYLNFIVLFYLTFFTGYSNKCPADNPQGKAIIGLNKNIIVVVGDTITTGFSIYTDLVKPKYCIFFNLDLAGLWRISDDERYGNYKSYDKEIGFTCRIDVANYKNQYFGFYLGKKFLLKKKKED